jgi:putative oxidoreductase
MKKAQVLAANIVPVLARLLLCLAFLPAGWHHVMDYTEFQGAEAERLRVLGVNATVTRASSETLVTYGSHGEPVESSGGVLPARSLHELTLSFDARGMPRPQIAAWIVGVIELVGGGLILVGLLSRVWGVGIALWSIALFGLSGGVQLSWGDMWATSVPLRASLFGLITIATLSLFIACTGPGAYSFDALIFKKGGGGGGGKG